MRPSTTLVGLGRDRSDLCSLGNKSWRMLPELRMTGPTQEEVQ